MAPTKNLDDLPYPKVPGLACEHCPFDYDCDGFCILGYGDRDGGGGHSPATVGS